MKNANKHDSDASPPTATEAEAGLLGAAVRFFLEQKLVVALLVIGIVLWGIAVAPFDWETDWLPRDPVPVDAIPNLGENQQIVFTEWPGRSPQDVEDQLTYPLTVSLMGVPGVREVRSQSAFGFSSIFIIFEEDIEFYWSRSRIIEKLNSLPPGAIPSDAQPALGPDATGLGQIFWYTLEGRDPDGNPIGGWDLHELRSVQDWYVRYGLLSATGISEIASIGGYQQEYQVDVDPDALRAHDVSLAQVINAVRQSNLDVGARTTEINRVEYIVRGLGFIENLDDIEQAIVRSGPDATPVRVRDVAHVTLGPAERRGALTISGAEAVGGVAVVREGFNPLAAINNVKAQIEAIAPGLPSKPVVDWDRITPAGVEAFAADAGFEGLDGAQLNRDAWLDWLRTTDREEWPEWVTTSRLTIEPFYDRTGLIHETLGTLNDALVQQILVTIIVVLVLVMHLRTALVISAMLPLSVLFCFIAMKLFGVDANIVALAGIAIAIGTIVDMGVIVVENLLKHLKEAPPEEPRIEVVARATQEVGSAILTAISTTIVSFLPVFTMTGAEGKMFIPLAYTKTFVLVGAIIVALTVVPAATHILIAGRSDARRGKRARWFGLGLVALLVMAFGLNQGWGAVVAAGTVLLLLSVYHLVADRLPQWAEKIRQGGAAKTRRILEHLANYGRVFGSIVAIIVVAWLLTSVWEPLGPEPEFIGNLLFVTLILGGVLGLFGLFALAYRPLLRWSLRYKPVFLIAPCVLVLWGGVIWLGFDRVFAFVPVTAERTGMGADRITQSDPWVWAHHAFPGLGREFMPALDEGSFLWMPTTMPHASMGEALAVLQYQDLAMASVPEVDTVAGKIGRAETALDPAPISMVETVINYKSEYKIDDAGRRINFQYDRAAGDFVRDENGELIPDRRGRPYRQWRDHIRSPDDIWDEIVAAARLPGTTSAPKLQPIETRLVMLQTGMRAPMGVKVRGPDLATIEGVLGDIERFLREVPQVSPATVNADRVVGKPYLELEIDREAIGRYGLNIMDVQQVIRAAIGGQMVTTTVEGRERYPVRVRYPRERRNEIEDLGNVLVAAADGTQVPLAEVVNISYERGPQMIRSEDTFLVSYVTFGGQRDMAEVDVVEAARAYLDHKVASGELSVPPGVSWHFAGDYENQLRAAATLRVVLPIAMGIIFLILYFQFKTVATTLIVFSGIAIAWAGGFIALWFYGQPWFADFNVFGMNMRDLFQVGPVNLSVAVWVGFLALFGIAVDNGVVVATYLRQLLRERQPDTPAGIREVAVEAGLRRLRPCLMTTATTILALLPVLTATGRGADIMLPMALPSVGGMFFVLLTLVAVPVLYSLAEEWKLRLNLNSDARDQG
ncbi:MAG: efflux RND transporter permease subunit [Opitutales bacterium]